MDLYKPTGPELQRLVGNPDAYAVQYIDREGKGQWKPVRERLSPAVIAKHRAGDITVGTYIVNPPDQARTLVFDVDADTDDEANDMLKQLTATLININASQAPAESGRLTWTTEWSGRKGWHVWILAEDFMPAETLYRLGRGIREEAGFPAMEVFPKQTHVDLDRVTRTGGTPLGNLVKLPGGKHLVTGQANDVLGAVDAPVPVSVLTQLAGLYPEVALRTRNGGAQAEVAYPCVDCIQRGVTNKRNIHYFHLAVMLRRWSLSEDNIRIILGRANVESGQPLPDDEIETIVQNSRYSGPVCGQLDDENHCGEQCMLNRAGGLYTRPKSLQWAQPGEKVVMEVESRTNETIELAHPDAAQGRVSLNEAGRTQDKDGNA